MMHTPAVNMQIQKAVRSYLHIMEMWCVSTMRIATTTSTDAMIGSNRYLDHNNNTCNSVTPPVAEKDACVSTNTDHKGALLEERQQHKADDDDEQCVEQRGRARGGA